MEQEAREQVQYLNDIRNGHARPRQTYEGAIIPEVPHDY